ncbi:hypothetical protein CR513_40324, partial [Mucuna pruriens]
MNLTILDVVKKEVVPKKSGMTIIKNQHDELGPMQIQNSWRVYILLQKIKSSNSQGSLSFSFHRSSPGKINRKVPLVFSGWFLRLHAKHLLGPAIGFH